MRLTSDGNRNPSQKETQLPRYFLLVKLMILLEDELSGPRAQSQTQILAMLVLAGLLRFVTGIKIWREFCQTCLRAFSRSWNPPRLLSDLRTILIALSCCLCSIVVIGQSRVREC